MLLTNHISTPPSFTAVVSLQGNVEYVGFFNSHTELELSSRHVVPLNREATEENKNNSGHVSIPLLFRKHIHTHQFT